MPPVKPMLAKLSKEIPVGDFVYEPKWDGFRCIVFRDGDSVELGSRNEKPLSRYFPEVCEAVRRSAADGGLPERCVVDGEIILVGPDGKLEFEMLQQRIHPAESRIKKLAAEWPASFVAFDLLALDDRDLRDEPFAERRMLLQSALGETAKPPVYLTPATVSAEEATDWFERFEGAGLDGVIAKPVAVHYCEDKRSMFKIKHERTADCVVAGFRWHKSGGIVGSLLLGLFDDAGGLRHVGVTASFTMARRKELVDELAPYRAEGARRTSVGRVGRVHDRIRRGLEGCRCHGWQPMECRQGHVMGAAACRTRRRGGLRLPPGRALPPRHHVPPLAARPRPDELHLQPARSRHPQRPHRHLPHPRPLTSIVVSVEVGCPNGHATSTERG